MYRFNDRNLLAEWLSGMRLEATVVVLCLLLIFVQIAVAKHAHADSSLLQPDCELCLKLNSNDDALLPVSLALPEPRVSVHYSETVPFYFNFSLPNARSRAPPAA